MKNERDLESALEAVEVGARLYRGTTIWPAAFIAAAICFAGLEIARAIRARGDL